MTGELDLLRQVGVTGAIDIAIVTVIVYGILVWLRRSRTGSVLRGVLIIGGVYLVARQFNLVLTSSALEAFFAILLVAAIVIFRNELRRAVEQIANFSRRRTLRLRRKTQSPPPDRLEQVLVHTLTDLAKRRIGALVVVEGDESLEPHLDGGTDLDGEPSEPLLQSLFDTHSIGHDGAVVVSGGRLRRFAAHLPLSTNFQALGHRGTRHAAALGLAELTDALCLVVSEERGEISIAHEGQLTSAVGSEELAAEIHRFVGRRVPRKRSPGRAIKREAPALLAALSISVLLWFVLVHGSTVTQRTLTVPVEYVDLPADRVVAGIKPTKVTVTFAGPRREFYFLNSAAVQLVLPLGQARVGTRVVPLSASDLSYPAGLTVKSIEPSHLALHLSPRARTKEAP